MTYSKNRRTRFALGGVQHTPDIHRVAFHPGFKSRGRQQVIDPHGQCESVFGGEEKFKVHHPDAFKRGRLDRMNQSGQIKGPALGPDIFKQVGQQNVLTAGNRVGLNADKG